MGSFLYFRIHKKTYIMENHFLQPDSELFNDIRQMIEEAKKAVGRVVNAGMTVLYWNIGKRINNEILQNNRSEYGEKILPTLSAKLVAEYGKKFEDKKLRRMVQFSKKFPEQEIVVTLSRQLSWSHFMGITPTRSEIQREFYIQMCRNEKWSVQLITELLPKDLLKEKLHQFFIVSKRQMENRI